MTYMPNYSKSNVILVRYPFSDLSGAKARPAVVVNAPHVSQDVLIAPLIVEPLVSDFSLDKLSLDGSNQWRSLTETCEPVIVRVFRHSAMEAHMSMDDCIMALFMRVDTALGDIPKDPQARLYPSNVR